MTFVDVDGDPAFFESTYQIWIKGCITNKIIKHEWIWWNILLTENDEGLGETVKLPEAFDPININLEETDPLWQTLYYYIDGIKALY